MLQTLSSSVDLSSVESSHLSPLISSTPLTLALAASTINLYSASMEQAADRPQSSALALYLELLGDQLGDSPTTQEEVTAACVSLYVEAATTQLHVLHTFDLLGSLEPTCPVPASLVQSHLSSKFYQLPPLIPPVPAGGTPAEPQDMSLLAQIKLLIPFGNKNTTLASPKLEVQDKLYFLRDSPIIAFKKYSNEGFELLQVHSTASKELAKLFLKTTVQRLEETHVKEAQEKFNATAWFRQYRTFDTHQTLAQYCRSLPGINAVGVLTQEKFPKSQFAESSQVQYSEYLHLVSHNHRILTSILSEIRALDDSLASTLLGWYIRPHLSHLSSIETLSQSDRSMCSYGLASIASAVSKDTTANLSQYQNALEEQIKVLGSQSPAVARTLTDMASLLFSQEDVSGAKNLLESALQIYQKIPPKTRSYETNLDLGLAMSSRAVVASSQGDKTLSKDLLEQALGLYQVLPEGGDVSIHQRRLVANTLTDLAHAHLTLGNLVMAQKYVELSVMAQPVIYPEGSEETVRALTVAGTVYALLGDPRESRRVSDEAGKHRAKIRQHTLAYL